MRNSVVSYVAFTTKPILILFVLSQMNGLPGILHVTSVATVICGLLALGKYIIYKQTESKAMCLECKWHQWKLFSALISQNSDDLLTDD